MAVASVGSPWHRSATDLQPSMSCEQLTTKRMLVARLKSVPFILSSFSRVPSRACARLLLTVSYRLPRAKLFKSVTTHLRSRKLSRYMRMSSGSRCQSTFRMSFFDSARCHSASLALNWR